ncbi:hypothetical protein FNU76_02260 [Chitinimonas arctica]|uniref:Uncharacterized protein n=1 Tax=Chitinimonas arctica TaxID=2594795 RepID=A0A516SB19_9NEIS|nr:hypothetical protein [Chitinimonas arctica]QDQ25268.1 hypothetical protein FNU76_02260 [Chitinimonas arctica]
MQNPIPPDRWREQVDHKLADLSTQMQQNTAITSEVREILDTVRGGMRVLEVLGTIAKWVTPIVMLVTAVLAFIHQLGSGDKP